MNFLIRLCHKALINIKAKQNMWHSNILVNEKKNMLQSLNNVSMVLGKFIHSQYCIAEVSSQQQNSTLTYSAGKMSSFLFIHKNTFFWNTLIYWLFERAVMLHVLYCVFTFEKNIYYYWHVWIFIYDECYWVWQKYEINFVRNEKKSSNRNAHKIFHTIRILF